MTSGVGRLILRAAGAPGEHRGRQDRGGQEPQGCGVDASISSDVTGPRARAGIASGASTARDPGQRRRSGRPGRTRVVYGRGDRRERPPPESTDRAQSTIRPAVPRCGPAAAGDRARPSRSGGSAPRLYIVSTSTVTAASAGSGSGECAYLPSRIAIIRPRTPSATRSMATLANVMATIWSTESGSPERRS